MFVMALEQIGTATNALLAIGQKLSVTQIDPILSLEYEEYVVQDVEIQFEKDVSNIIEWKNIIIFDKSENTVEQQQKQIKKQPILWIIWPEWWLTDNDYKTFWDKIKTVSLWDTVLRTETASIIAARTIKNIF